MRNPNLLLALTLTLHACSDDGDDAPDTPEEFCDQWAAAACSEDVVQACQAANADACRASQVAACLGEVPATGFSGEQADACIDAVEEAYEDADLTVNELRTVLRRAPPCDALVRGPSAEGESCMQRSDCDAPGGFDCVFKGGAASGTCQRPESVGPGQNCSAPNAVCTEGFYCNGSNCIAGEAAGASCNTHAQCGPTGYCDVTTSLCAARLPVSAPCDFDEQCTSNVCYQFSASERVCTDRLRLSRSEPICADLR